MIRSADGTVRESRQAREAQIAELKNLIAKGKYETLEKLEEAVDAFLWRDENQSDSTSESDELCGESNTELRRGHPK